MIVGVLVVALVVILLMWMNDRESVDPDLDVDIGWIDMPALALPA